MIPKVVMGTAWRSPFGLACPECNQLLIAPKESGYVNKHEVFHFWSCEECDHEMEQVVDIRFNAESRRNESGLSLDA